MRAFMKNVMYTGAVISVLCAFLLCACTLGSSDDDNEDDNVLDRGSDGLDLTFQGRYYVANAAMDIYVAVHDEETGETVENLTDENFEFAEDGKDMGVEQKAYVTQENELDIVLVLDLSKSMEGSALENLKEAASRFVENLKGDIRIGIVTFANEYRTAQRLTTRMDRVQDVIESLSVEGDFTNFYGALYYAAGLFSDGRLNVGRAVIAFTDGRDNREEKKPQEVASVYKSKDIFLYSVGLGAEEDLDSEELEDLSTSDRFYRVDEARSLDGIFADIAADLQSTYRLRYCTPKLEGDHVLRITTTKGADSGWIEISFNADELSSGECDPTL